MVLMLLHIIMIKSIHNLRKDMRAHDHALTFVITRKFKEKKIEPRTVSTKFSSRFTVLLKLYAKGKKEYLMEKKYRLAKISGRKGRFISSLFLVYFSVTSK